MNDIEAGRMMNASRKYSYSGMMMEACQNRNRDCRHLPSYLAPRQILGCCQNYHVDNVCRAQTASVVPVSNVVLDEMLAMTGK